MKTKSNLNPLSQARLNSSNSTDERSKKFDTIWHKKSGLGYVTFYQYYMQQPSGIVVEKQESLNNSNNTITNEQIKQLFVQQTTVKKRQRNDDDNDEPATKEKEVGMSRAAKKRRQKKKQQQKEGNKIVIQQQQQKLEGEGKTTKKKEEDETEKKRNNNLFELFCETLSKPLSVTFRLRNVTNYCNSNANDNTYYKEQREELKLLLEEEEFQTVVKPISSSNNDGIYQCTMDKTTLNKKTNNTNDIAFSLKELLLTSSESGLLARQEIGSMLPVLGLSESKLLRKNAIVLDMCASPGTKTLQVLEKIGNRGKLIANDIHPKRLIQLKDAIQRSGVLSPLLSLTFTKEEQNTNTVLSYSNLDATKFPSFKKEIRRPHVVLADVPCSGDGTIRKDPSVLRSWSPYTAHALHELQIKILWRSLQLVRTGGVVSYSTCSMNPIENEAVVQAVLLKAAGLDDDDDDDDDANNNIAKVELCDYPTIQGIKLRPGVTNWKVLTYTNTTDKDDDDDIIHWNNIAASNDDLPETLFPAKEEIKQKLKLERCRRLWPQDNNTGGFFVAFLRKNSELYKKKKE